MSKASPSSNAELVRIRDELLRLHAQARALGEHQVAYHALAAAMHAAESLGEPGLLDQLEAAAREHGAWIDQNQPRHPISSHSAASRGHPGIFEQLAITAAAIRTRLKAEQVRRK